MGNRVLLISPNRCVMPEAVFPLGLAHIQSALEQAGHVARVLDRLTDAQRMEEVLRGFQPDYVGISLRNIDNVIIRKPETYFESLREVCEAVRRVRQCPVVVGGSGYSIYPERLLEWSGADFGICGEGEGAFVALLEALGKGGDYAGIPGLVCRQGGKIVMNPPKAAALAARKECPSRPAEWVSQYLEIGGTMNLQTQRGCAHRCCYCTYPLIEGVTHRRRDAETVAEEVAQLERLGTKFMFIVDSVFNTSPRHVTEMCEAMIRRKTTLKWGCFLRPQGLTWELMDLMKRAGLSHVEFGSDSFCDAVLEQYDKRLAFADILRSSELAREVGIEHCHFLICGGPGETPATLENSFENSLRLQSPTIMAVVGMRIYPGTRLAERALGEGRIIAEMDLLQPTYYLAPGLTEAEVFGRLKEFAKRSPNWISSDPPPFLGKLIASLRERGVVGPLWSYFTMMQRVMR